MANRPSARPLIWLLVGSKAGDNAQLRAVAKRLGAETREWQLSHNLLREVPNAWLGASRSSLQGQVAFEPPWPDMVLGVGRRTVPAARWIRKASPKSTRLVWLGRPRAPLHWFDLVVTTRQYGLTEAPNVLRLPLPLIESPQMGKPSRRVALLGGPSWSVKITPEFLRTFARAAVEDASTPVSLLTSPRTPSGAAAYLKTRLGKQAEIYDWASAKGVDSPYRAWLSEAASLVVSGDSISMICDAVLTARPVTVVPAPMTDWLSLIGRIGPGRTWLKQAGNWSLLAPPPNLQSVFVQLTEAGLAEQKDGLIHLSDAAPKITQAHRQAIARISALLP